MEQNTQHHRAACYVKRNVDDLGNYMICLNICSAAMIYDHLIFAMGISSLSAAILGTAPHNTPEMQGKFPKVWLFSWRNMACFAVRCGTGGLGGGRTTISLGDFLLENEESHMAMVRFMDWKLLQHKARKCFVQVLM